MPSDKKNKTASKAKPDKSLSFEDALEELEKMVETMESGQLPLEELITNYERGAQLISHCESVLGDARKRLHLITLKPKAGGSNSSPDISATPDTEDSQGDNSPSNDTNDDEIRLF